MSYIMRNAMKGDGSDFSVETKLRVIEQEISRQKTAYKKGKPISLRNLDVLRAIARDLRAAMKTNQKG